MYYVSDTNRIYIIEFTFQSMQTTKNNQTLKKRVGSRKELLYTNATSITELIYDQPNHRLFIAGKQSKL